MKIYSVVGADEEEIYEKRFNIYLGVSLGNKWFTKDNIMEHLEFALKYTREKVGVVIADKLHAINYQVRDRKSPERALKKALRIGDAKVKEIEEIIRVLPKEEQEKIDIIRWKDIENGEHYERFYKKIKEEFEKNGEFKNTIMKIVEGALIKEKGRIFSEKEKIMLCEYILAELSELLHGFKHKGIFYNVYLYPHASAFTKLIGDILSKKKFLEFYNKLPIKPDVFIELR